MSVSLDPGWARMNRKNDFPEHKAILTALYELAGGPRMLDLGTGEAHITKNFEGDYVDLVIRPTAPGKTIRDDIRNAPKRFAGFKYNLLIMGDSLEHLTQSDGADLLEDMEKICGATAIFTPVGPWKLNPEATDPDSHKSAWTPEMFWFSGWEVLEMPTCHRFEGGEFLGAFWAWQFRNAVTPPAEAVLQHAGLDL
jgi:hypothetical protein